MRLIPGERHTTAIRSAEHLPALTVHDDLKASLVHQPVVMTTEQHQVIQTGLAAMGPMLNVMGIDEAPVTATREAAMPIPSK